jgi:hypothetical protein
VKFSFQVCWRHVVESNVPESLAVEQVERPESGLAKPCSVRKYGLEHRLRRARRRADDAENLRCGFLPLQRLVALSDELSNVRLSFGGGSGWLA